MMSLNEALAMLPGAVPVGDGGTVFRRVHSDTRTLQAGDLFVALRGDRFDAHSFLPQAAQAGAAAALAERGLASAHLPGLEVKDSLQALQHLATGWRQRWQGPLIAVTGSNGKTTVTQMLASILRAAYGEQALATVGNLNNHIGVPLTLLRLRAQHRAAVVEMGMNHPGEIELLARMAAPTVALVNNAQREHQEFMASVAAVAVENGAVIAALSADGVAVFPADDPRATTWRQQAGQRRTMSFALDSAADVTVRHAAQTEDGWRAEVLTPQGRGELRLYLAGRHNLKNALAACTAALAAGVPLQQALQGLAAFRPVKGRSHLSHLKLNGQTVTLVDDSYNANPDSVWRPLTCWPACPRRNGSSWVTWAKWAAMVRRFTLRWARAHESGACSTSGALACCVLKAPAHTGRARVISPPWIRCSKPSINRVAGTCCRRRLLYSSKVRASWPWSARGCGSANGGRPAGAPLMLLSLSQWLMSLWPEHLGFLRVVQYLTFRAVLAAMTSLLIGLAFGPWVIRRLTEMKVGQPIREYGMQSHLGKRGTPTMGGVLILIGIGVSTLLWFDWSNRFVWVVMVVTFGFGMVGWVDDYRKVVRKDPEGMRSREKFFWQALIGLIAALYLAFSVSETSTLRMIQLFGRWIASGFSADLPPRADLMVPFFKSVSYPLGVFGFIALSWFVIVGCSNAVNFTDGLDGLAIMPVVLVGSALGIFAYVTGQRGVLEIPAVPVHSRHG